jgi:hypothetical protein
MLTTRLWWLALATGVLSACNAKCVDCSTTDDPTECRNLTDGRACMASTQCAQGLTCFPKNSEGALGRCRVSCPGGQCAQRGDTSRFVSCIDLGPPHVPSCIPGPRSDTVWKVSIESLKLPSTRQGQFWDSGPNDAPDPFVCFTFTSAAGQQQLCTSEQNGYTSSWTYPFTATMPWSLLQNVSVTVFDSDAIGTFEQCEGLCPALSGWAKESAYGMAWDLRPQWDGEDQTFVLKDAAGLELKLRFRETYGQ